MSCKCQSCGKQYKVDLLIPDNIWLKINGKEAGLLCGSCIMEKIGLLGEYTAYEIKPTTNQSVYNYYISAGNPESDDFTIDLQHEKEFTQDEFTDIAEQAIVYALEKDYNRGEMSSISSIETVDIIEFLQTKGFVYPQEKVTVAYCLEPYWGKDAIRSDKLRQWVDRKNIEDKPKYLEGVK